MITSAMDGTSYTDRVSTDEHQLVRNEVKRMKYIADYNTSVELARIVAETHMMAQIVTRQYDYCMFLYDEDGYVYCDGDKKTLTKFLSESMIPWFMMFVPDESFAALFEVYRHLSNEFDGDVEYNAAFIQELHVILSKKMPTDRELDCKFKLI